MLTRLARFILFYAFILLCWWALTEGDNQAWWFGAPLAFIAALLMLSVWPAFKFNLSNFLFLFPKIFVFFLWQSLQGGWDVAKCALSRHPKVKPVIIDYALQLPQGWRRDIWLATIGLMPGTLSVSLDGDLAKVHVFDRDLEVQPGLVKFEQLLLAWR